MLGYVKNIFNNLKELSKSKENSFNSQMSEKLKYFFSDKDVNNNNNTSLFLSNCFDLNDNLEIASINNANNNNNVNNCNSSNNSLMNNKFEMNFEPKDKEGKLNIY